MDVRLIVAWNIRRLRVAKQISQDDLAHNAEVERSYVGYLERATKNPTILTLEKLAGALDCEVAAFFTEIPMDAELTEQLPAGRKKT
ncbi:MAG: helix-turn-helix transcriptional regulator [Pseudomonadota bacterium]